MANVVSHNTDAMRDWSTGVDQQSTDYDELINKFYAIVDRLVGSEFRGGLSNDFMNNVYNQRTKFFEYSELFRECAEYLKSKASNIDSDEALLKGMINRANPLG